jgi:hypothetical protein
MQTLLRSTSEDAERRDREQLPGLEFEGLAKTRAKKTMGRAEDLLKSIDERIGELQRLVDTGTETASAVSHINIPKQAGQ